MFEPIPMVLTCPECSERHIDEGEFATKPHHTHACQRCGHCWRPAIENTVGARFLPGFKNEKPEAEMHAEQLVAQLVWYQLPLEAREEAGRELVRRAKTGALAIAELEKLGDELDELDRRRWRGESGVPNDGVVARVKIRELAARMRGGDHG